MPPAKQRQAKTAKSSQTLQASLEEALSWLEQHGTEKTRAGMSRYGIVTPKAFGVTMADLKVLGKRLGRQHPLALALWDSGWYEARLLSALVGDPERLTLAQMQRWCRDFDNWAVCDTVCLHLFDRSPHAFAKVAAWARHEGEFVRRAAFALLASLALHDQTSDDARFWDCLPLIEQGASDGRNFVKKGVSWALRAVGRRSTALHTESLALARRLAASSEAPARWVGRDALRDLAKPAVRARLSAREAKRGASSSRMKTARLQGKLRLGEEGKAGPERGTGAL